MPKQPPDLGLACLSSYSHLHLESSSSPAEHFDGAFWTELCCLQHLKMELAASFYHSIRHPRLDPLFPFFLRYYYHVYSTFGLLACYGSANYYYRWPFLCLESSCHGYYTLLLLPFLLQPPEEKEVVWCSKELYLQCKISHCCKFRINNTRDM